MTTETTTATATATPSVIAAAVDLRAQLQGNIMAIDFTKTDGSTRKLIGTTIPDVLAVHESLTDQQLNLRNSKPVDGDLIRVWDVENDGWRAFHMDQVTHTEVVPSRV